MDQIPNPYQPPAVAKEVYAESGDQAMVRASDFLAGQKLHFGWKIFAAKMFFVAGGIFGFLVGLLLFFGSKTDFYQIYGVILIAGGILIFLRGVFNDYLLLRKNEKIFREMSLDDGELVKYIITPDHLSFSTQNADVRVKWREFHQWRENEKYILAYRHKKMFHVIPLGQLSSEVASQIRSYLTEHCRKV
jgi:hypothetical protein